MPEPVEWDTPGALEAKKCPEPSSFRRGAARDQYRDAGMHGPRQYEISWRLVYDESVRYLSKAEVWFLLQVARRLGANLLMNIGPRGDGSIHPNDDRTLREVSRRIREAGFPGERTSN